LSRPIQAFKGYQAEIVQFYTLRPVCHGRPFGEKR